MTPDIFIVPAFSKNGELLRFDAIARFPEVARSVRVPSFLNSDGVDVSGFSDPSLPAEDSRLIEGRRPNPGRVDEASVNIVASQKRHVHVGDTLRLDLVDPGFSPSDVQNAQPLSGPTVKLKIVGITASLGDFVSVADPGLTVTPAFVDAFQDRTSVYDLYVFVLKRHDADLTAFRSHVSELTSGTPVLFVEGRNGWSQIQRSFDVQAAALLMLAVFLGLVTTLVFTQILARLTRAESVDERSLSALGMSRSQQIGVDALRGVLIGTVTAGVGVLLAICVSGLMPFGRPRLAETSPGLSAPAVLMVGGFCITLVIVFLQNTLPAMVRRRDRRVGPSRVAEGAAVALRGAAPGVGVHFALEPGPRRDAVPVRSALLETTICVVAVAMSLTFSSCLGHLLETPRLYGWAWDARVDVGQGGPDTAGKLEATPGVAEVGWGNISAQASIGAVVTELVAMEPGPISPVVLAGRQPLGSDEVALGGKTLRATHARIGTLVPLAIQGQNVVRRLRVTGVVVLPVDTDTSTLGEGALVTEAGLREFVPDVVPDSAVVRFVAHVDRARVLQDVASAVGGQDHIQLQTKPSALVDFGNVRSLPLVLAGLMACLGLATIAHVLTSTVHRRRRDLAVLNLDPPMNWG